MPRRKFFNSTAAVAVSGAVAGCAAPPVMQGSARTPFAVAGTFVPVVGSDQVFPVRRIYCIGRNYRAHAIAMGSTPTASRRSGRWPSRSASCPKRSSCSPATSYSGTPENVGPVVRGDVIEMHIDGLPNLSVKIV